MGIDVGGGMLVGRLCSDVKFTWDDIEDHGMDAFSPYFDAAIGECYVGYSIPDVPVNQIEGPWLMNLRKSAERFEKLTGLIPDLIGMQDIT